MRFTSVFLLGFLDKQFVGSGLRLKIPWTRFKKSYRRWFFFIRSPLGSLLPVRSRVSARSDNASAPNIYRDGLICQMVLWQSACRLKTASEYISVPLFRRNQKNRLVRQGQSPVRVSLEKETKHDHHLSRSPYIRMETGSRRQSSHWASPWLSRNLRQRVVGGSGDVNKFINTGKYSDEADYIFMN